jgi:outer membrane protein TolC
MNNKIISIILIISTTQLFGQPLESVLQEIAKNNATLQMLRKQNEARELQYKTTLFPDNPEITYGHFPGNTNAIGTKKVFGVSQTLDFPSVYFARNKLVKGLIRSNEIQYRELRRQKLLEAKKVLLKFIYTKKRLQVNHQRMVWTKAFRDDMKRRREEGDISRLEVNKAKIQLAKLRNEQQRIRNQLMQDSLHILQLNNNIVPEKLTALSFPEVKSIEKEALVGNFLQRHPKAALSEQQVSNSQQQLRLSKSEYLPDITIGYESEQVMSDTHRGIRAGITIPLWGDRHTIKHSKAEVEAAEAARWVTTSKQTTMAKELYEQWHSLKTAYAEFYEAIDGYSNPDKMRKAHAMGEISSIELFMELDYYYELKDDLLEQQYLLFVAQAELFGYKL